MSLITLTQLADHVAAMREVVNIPLIVDADTGFGNAVSVGHTVKVLERAGANCIQIEDQVFPKRCGHFDGKEVVETAEFVAKIKAALDARTDEDFLIMARTDAIERVSQAFEAGADCLFVEAPRTLEEIRQVPGIADAPFLINLVYGGKTPILGQQELADLGYAMALYAGAAVQSAIQGMQQVLGHIKRTGSIEGALDLVATFDERQRLVRKADYDVLEQTYAV
jgi:2-methylisocitrate lyase-like PEP mutase family enzyme